MHDKELVRELLTQTVNAADTILLRFSSVDHVDYFTGSQAGMEKLDSICMQLMAMGEGLKKMDTLTDGTMFSEHPEINWKGAKAMRDIIGHHYFEIDAEVVFDVCENKIKNLRNTLIEIIRSI